VRKSVIAALTIGALLTVTTLRVIDLVWWRGQTLNAAGARARNLTFILSEYIRQTFAAGDAALRQLEVYSRRVGGPNAPDSEWAPILASARAGLTGVGSLSVIDANGTIRHSTLQAFVGQSRRDRYVFQRLVAQPTDDFVLDTPFPSVVYPGQCLIVIGRRLTRADGTFEGIVAATFTAAGPRNFLRTLQVGPSGVVWVFHPDGIVLFREPSETNPLGETAAGHPILEAATRSGEYGTLEAAITPGGPVFLHAFHLASTPPVIVAVSLNRNDVLHDFRHQIGMSTLFFLTLTMMMAATLAVLFRQMDAKAAAEDALTRARDLDAKHLADMNDRLADALSKEQRARRDVEEASDLKDEFLMTVSHELRTPLTAIHGWARMLLTGAMGEAQTTAALKTIERNVRVQTRLIDDLLDVSRVMGGKLHLEMREVKLPAVVEHAVESVRPSAAAKHIQLETAIDPDAGTIQGDPERIQQIVWNLISNAIKFTQPGGHVQLRVARTGSEVEITVSDDGAGISPEFLPHVFERFRQEHGGTKRRYGGLGLGLAIVRHLVDMHGGTIHAESAGEGRGATFRVHLPVAVPVAASILPT